MKEKKVTAVIVTYNRRALLEKCLVALSAGTIQPDKILVVDNASTDGTSDWLRHWLPTNLPQASLLAMDSNTGGAGGFYAGLKSACDDGAEWVWMMDDDACPHSCALEELLKIAQCPSHLYGSLAVSGAETSWSTTLRGDRRVVRLAKEVPDSAEVDFIPLLGFLVHRKLVEKIGYPDAGFFILGDDAEYCVRARRANADIIIAGRSQIEHPRTPVTEFRLFGNRVCYLRLAPWKRYYDTRNRILIARKYYGIRLLTQTIPGSIVRLFAALLLEPHKLAQFWAFCAGMFDGLFGIKGRRHTKWGISQ